MKNDEQLTPKSGRFGRTAWICLAVVWILATVGSYLFLDSIVSRRLWDRPIYWHYNVWVDGFRQLGRAGVPIWLIAVWSCLTRKWRPTVVVMIAMILVGISVSPLKAIVRRTRPIHTLTAMSEQSPPEIPWQKKVSFPSGDTAVAFAGATALSLSWGRLWTPALFVAAGAVGLLRITSLVHYPSDVLAGMLIGILAGCCAPRLVLHRLPGRLLERLHELKDWQRLVFGSLLALVVPALSPFLGMRPLRIFLEVYAIPAAMLILVTAWIHRTGPRWPEQVVRGPEKVE